MLYPYHVRSHYFTRRHVISRDVTLSHATSRYLTRRYAISRDVTIPVRRFPVNDYNHRTTPDMWLYRGHTGNLYNEGEVAGEPFFPLYGQNDYITGNLSRYFGCFIFISNFQLFGSSSLFQASGNCQSLVNVRRPGIGRYPIPEFYLLEGLRSPSREIKPHPYTTYGSNSLLCLSHPLTLTAPLQLTHDSK